MNDIDVWPYSLPLTRPWSTSTGRTSVRQGFIVEVAGSFGDAAAIPGAHPRELAAIARQLLRPSASGRSQPTGPARHALLEAGLSETARKSGITLGALLGNRDGRTPRASVLTNAAVPVLAPSATVARAKGHVRNGFRTIKLKLSGGSREIQRVAAVREAIGSDIALRLDPNGAWNPKSALKTLDALEPFGIEYVEQPTPPGKPQTFLALAERSPIPLAPDEDAASLASLPALLSDGVLEFVVLKPMLLGGPDIALDAVTAVEDAGASAIITDVVESGIGRAGALHVASLTKDPTRAHGLASGTFLRQDLVSPPLLPRRGVLRTPRRPGLGVTVRRKDG